MKKEINGETITKIQKKNGNMFGLEFSSIDLIDLMITTIIHVLHFKNKTENQKKEQLNKRKKEIQYKKDNLNKKNYSIIAETTKNSPVLTLLHTMRELIQEIHF